MATVFNRGTKDHPRYVAKYRAEQDAAGKWIWRMKLVPEEEQGKGKKHAEKWADWYEEQVMTGKVSRIAPAPAQAAPAETCGELMDKWAKGLTNRSADDDRGRLKLHVREAFAHRPLSAITVATVLEWIGDLRAKTKAVTITDAEGKESKKVVRALSEPTIRHCMNLLSRFFAWAVERGHMPANPVRSISQGSRPKMTPKGERPWLQDDVAVRKLFNALPAPVNGMFLVGNQSGLRLGEICGLRLSDAEFMENTAEHGPVLRVMYQYDGGPLKEDKEGQEKKVKWPPVTDDEIAVLTATVERRKAEGAEADDLLWPCPTRDGKCYRKEYIEDVWDEARAKVAKEHPAVGELTFYAATRHSFVSRSLKNGATLEEVSEAVGHSSPAVTQRFYNHLVRKRYSGAMRRALGISVEKGGDVVPLFGASTKTPAKMPDRASEADSGAVDKKGNSRR